MEVINTKQHDNAEEGDRPENLAGSSSSHTRLKQGYVLMLDVLGFKDMVSKDLGEEFINKWVEIRARIMEKKSQLEEKIKDVEIDILCLSDTVIICIALKPMKHELKPDLLISIIPSILDSFFMELFRDKIFMRGAISYGQYRCDMDSNIVMGKALEEAYEWHDVTDWIGVILSPSAKYASEAFVLNGDINNPLVKIVVDRFIKFNVPFKAGISLETYSFNWLKCGDREQDRLKLLTDITSVFSGVKYTTNTSTKYENTMTFVKSVLPVDVQRVKEQEAIRRALVVPT